MNRQQRRQRQREQRVNPPKNPLLERKFNEGYELGLKHGIDKSTSFFIDKFEGLEDRSGIGPKTMKIIRDQLGHEYFQEEDK